MISVCVQEPGKLALVEKPIPVLTNSTQVLIKTKYVGICGSDMGILRGVNPFATYPRVFGHEVAGEVIEVGKDVDNLIPGDHVVLEPIEYCGKCYACTHGQPNVCSTLKVSGVHVDGGGSQYLLSRASALHKISRKIPWELAVLAEPLTIGSQSCERANVGKNDVVLVIGAGTVGLCVMMNAKLRGAKVIIADIVDDKLEYARSKGADYTINSAARDLKEAVEEYVGERGVNVFVDAVGLPKFVEQGLELVSPAGRILSLGFGSDPIHVPSLALTSRQVTLLGSRLQYNQFPTVIQNLENGNYPVDDFVNMVFPVDQAKEAFDYALNHSGSYRKILLKMD